MRRLFATALIAGAFGCATSPLNDVIEARVESHGGYVVSDSLPSLRYSANRIPCELDARLGTHFFIEVPSGEEGGFSIVNEWTRRALRDDRVGRSENLGREVRRFRYPFTDRTGTFLILTLNEKSDLFPARYEQTVSSGSGRVLFRHQFTVPECPPAA